MGKVKILIPPAARRVKVDSADCRKPECGLRCEKD